MAEPFVIQDCVSIRGGYSDKPVFLAYENGEADTPHAKDKFIALASYNKMFMTLLVPKQEVRSKGGHLKGFPEKFIKHMQKLRDAAVDQMLMQHLVRSDPMGNHNAAQGLPKNANRLELFKAADVPKIITIHVHDIRDENGAIIAPRQAITLHSSDRRAMPVKIKLDEDTMTWLGHAMLHSWGDAPEVHEEDTKLHDIIHSRLKHGRIMCTVTNKAVILKKRDSRQQLTIPRGHFDDLETIEESVDAAVAALEVQNKRPNKRKRSAGSSNDVEFDAE